MVWDKHLGNPEYILIAIFFLLYGVYLLRMFFISRKLKVNSRRLIFKFLLRSSYFLLILFSILGPTFGNFKKTTKNESKEILIAIDISRSMDADDIIPTRLEKGKNTIRKIIHGLPNDKIGLLIFSENAYLHCPLTYDKNALEIFSSSLNSHLIEAKSTNFNDVFFLCLDNFSKSANTSSKVLLMISDGEDFAGNSEIYFDEFNKQGIPVITLGIGTEKGIPVKNLVHITEEHVYTKLNSKNLINISKNTGGSYFQISRTIDQTDELLNYINTIKGQSSGVHKKQAAANKYIYFLLIALLLIIVDTTAAFNVIKI
jgi:Ca-activated chloride channel homolog